MTDVEGATYMLRSEEMMGGLIRPVETNRQCGIKQARPNYLEDLSLLFCLVPSLCLTGWNHRLATTLLVVITTVLLLSLAKVPISLPPGSLTPERLWRLSSP
jgi:hypothetical protein